MVKPQLLPYEVIESLRKRAGMSVIRVGPSVGMSFTWGQKVCNGTLCPTLTAADQLAQTLGAREGERVALLTAVCRVKLELAGFDEAQIRAATDVLTMASHLKVNQ